jgi:hypothetical protein
MGGDVGASTVSNFLLNFNPALVGMSVGVEPSD